MFNVKGSIVESAILRQFTDLIANPVMTCKWTEMFRTTNRFDPLFDDLVKVSMDPKSKLEFDISTTSKAKNKRYAKQLNALSQVHRWLKEVSLPCKVNTQPTCFMKLLVSRRAILDTVSAVTF